MVVPDAPIAPVRQEWAEGAEDSSAAAVAAGPTGAPPASPPCQAEVAGRSFASVIDLSSAADRPLRLHYTLSGSGALDAVIVAAIGQAEWASVGFGDAMSGSRAVILTHAGVDGYLLPATRNAVHVNAAKGTFPLDATSVVLAGDAAVGLFAAQGFSPGQQGLVWAVGELSPDAQLLPTHCFGRAAAVLEDAGAEAARGTS